MASSQFILKEASRDSARVVLPADIIPVNVTCREGDSGSISFSNGRSCKGHCVGCATKRCILFSKDEFAFAERFKGFSHDRDLRVCPTDAISWNNEIGAPRIDKDKCINCGCCAVRCPVRAIYHKDGAFCVRLFSGGVPYPFARITPPLTPKYVAIDEAFQNVSYDGSLVKENDHVLNMAYAKLIAMLGRYDARIPNLLVRNLLFQVGVNAINSRCGDVYSRTDILFEFDEKLGVCEVEFNDAMIDTPRDIIEDVAIYVSRYGYDRREIVPLIVGLQFPNKRSEFWEVLYDIEKVLGIQTRSLTVGALMMLLWNQRKIVRGGLAVLPVVNSSNKSIAADIQKILCRPPSLGGGLAYNILEPLK